MRPIILLSCCILSLATTGCGDSSPEPAGETPAPPAGWPVADSAFTITVSSVQGANVNGGTHEMKVSSGSYVSGHSIIGAHYGANPAAHNLPCQVLGVIARGKPEAGKQWPILLDSGESSIPPGTASIIYADTCVSAEYVPQWLATSGTIRIDSIVDPDPRTVPSGSPAGTIKTVRLTLLDVKLVADPKKSGTSTGTFTLDGEIRIQAMSGMEQP